MENEKIQKTVTELRTKWTVNIFDTPKEGEYGLVAALYPNQRDNSFLVDITPSFTRLSWYDNGQPHTILLPGSKYFQKNKVGGVMIDPMTDDQARAETIAKLRELPQKNRHAGVILWAAADGSDGKKGVKQGTARYAFLEDKYSTEDGTMASGLNVLYAIQSEVKAPMYFDWDGSYVIGYGKGLFRK
jgi:hypothetical protein